MPTIDYLVLNQWYAKVLKQIEDLHNKKSHDYAEENDPFSNFTYAANYSGVSVNQVFDVLIGIKIARKIQLNRKDPLNESRQDTENDLANYLLIKAAWNLKEKENHEG